MSRLNQTDYGHITISDPGADVPTLVVKMLRCCHCGGSFPAKPVKALIGKLYSESQAREMENEGKTMRGWCINCQGPVCGVSCAACVPLEQLLENLEQGRNEDYKPVRVFVPNEIP